MSRVRGWCPSAHRPMASGDGLLVRVKQRGGRLSARCLQNVWQAADTFGNGVIDLTSRGNLQIRGVAEADHPALLAHLIDAGLVDDDPTREGRRNIAVTPFWNPGDVSERLYGALDARLNGLPELPGKMGYAIDTGPAPMLQDVSADVRLERSQDGQIVLRADGARRGRPVTETRAMDALTELIGWFVSTGGVQNGRMARHLKAVALPEEWQTLEPTPPAGRPGPGGAIGGRIYGVPFGRTSGADLARLIDATGADHVRVTPWRMLFLEDAAPVEVEGFLSAPDPVLSVAACPGAPACAQAEVETRAIGRALAGKVRTLHVSGCPKGCARQNPAEVTLVGNAGRFDLVRGGRAGDTPERSGLTGAEVLELFP